MSRAILYDATQCIGCKQCESACAGQNKLPYDDKIAAETVQSDHKYTVVQTKGDKFMRRLCQHCEDPACASVCPVGAFHKTADGPVLYDAYKCIGCRYCMVSCVFAVPKYEWGKLNPRVQKCIMCPEHIAWGKPTACAQACPTGATKCGEREELLREAKERISKSPSTYVNHVYGEHEVGGSNVLMISSIDFGEFGLPVNLPTTPLPENTRKVLSFIPDFVPLWGVVLGGIYFITHRREEVAQAEGKRNDGGER